MDYNLKIWNKNKEKNNFGTIFLNFINIYNIYFLLYYYYLIALIKIIVEDLFIIIVY